MQTNSELNGQQKSTQNYRSNNNNNNEEQSTNSSVFVRQQSANEHGYFLRSSVRQNRLDSNNNSTQVANRNGGQVNDDAKRPRHSTNRIRSTSNTASAATAISSTNNNNQQQPQQQSVLISQNENLNKINNSYAFMNNGGAVKRGYDFVDNMDGDQDDEHGNFSSNSMSSSGHRSPAKKPKSLVTFKDMKDFFELLESYPIKDFLLRDSCCLISDKYALAMVFTYFKRAKFTPEEFNTYNFFLALYLASDIEEDIEEYKYEIFPWALGSKWRSKFSSFLRRRDDLLKRIGYRAIVSRKCCEEVMNFIPDHFAWKRERSESHGGAVRGYLINKCRSLLSREHRIDEEDLNMPRGPGERPRPCPLCTMNNTLSIELNPIKYLSPAIHSHQKFMPTPSSVRSIPVQFPGHPHHHPHNLLSHPHHHNHHHQQQYLMNSTSSLRSNATTTDSEDNCLFNSSTSTSGYETCSSATTNTNSSVIDMNNNNLSFSNLNYDSFFMPNQNNNKKATEEDNKENHQSTSELKNDSSFALDTTLIANTSSANNLFKQPIGAPISGKNLSKQQKIKYPSVTGVNNYFVKDENDDDSAASDDEDADDVFSKHNSTSVILTKSQQHAASLGSLPQRNSSRMTTASSRKSTKNNQSTRRRQHCSLSTNALSSFSCQQSTTNANNLGVAMPGNNKLNDQQVPKELIVNQKI